MKKLKFIIHTQKKFKLKKIYNVQLVTKKNNLIVLGSYLPNVKLYRFIYPSIISSSKIGHIFSKQFSLSSLFYLKKILKKNL